MSDRFTVVLPVFDEAGHVAATIGALADAAERSPFAVDLIVVDDGSTDGGAARRRPTRRRGGCRAACCRSRTAAASARGWRVSRPPTGSSVLLPDARVRLHEDALAFVGERVAAGERVWNGHVEVDASGNPYGAFGQRPRRTRLARLLREPRTTSFGLQDFDRYPKGTTCFMVLWVLLLEALATFRSMYSDLRHANDDTILIRALRTRADPSLALVRLFLRFPRLAEVVPASLVPPRHRLPRRVRAARVTLLPGRGRLFPAQRRARMPR